MDPTVLPVAPAQIEWVPIIVAISAGLLALLQVWTNRKVGNLEIKVDGKLDKLIEAKEAVARGEGKAAEQAAQAGRDLAASTAVAASKEKT
jgi:hypothetical protein